MILRPIYVDQFPHKSLGVHVNLFANKLEVVQHRDRKKMLGLLIMVYMIETKSKNRLYIQYAFRKYILYCG